MAKGSDAERRSPIRRAGRLLAALLPALSLGMSSALIAPAVVAAESPGCATTTNASYTVQVCFTLPAPGAILSGNATVQAGVTVTTGSYNVYWLRYTLDGIALLNTYRAPYSFTLPTAQWADGTHTLAVYAESLSGGVIGSTTSPASISVTFANGRTTAFVNTNQPAISPGTTPAAGSPEIVAAVGDGASGESTSTDVANLISSWSPNLFLYLGDVYYQGSYTEFLNWYDSTFGRFRAISDPTIGNHEYLTPSGAGYFNYWNNEPHYYSYDAAGWHFISLDATQSGIGSTGWTNQLNWLAGDLAAHAGACILAYWHQPLFNIGQEGPALQTQPFWSALAAAHASIVLNGHDHNYQRWQPMDAAGNVSSTGITEFVDGTGGHGSTPFITTDPRMAIGTSGPMGALKLSLSPASAAFQFVETNGTTFDSGTVRCQGSGTLAGTVTDSQTHQAMAGATVAYDGSASGLGAGSVSTDAAGHYSFAGVAAGTYSVSVAATGEVPQTASVTVGGAATATRDFALSATAPPPFTDDFESGGVANWTTNLGLVPEQSSVHSGAWALEGNTTNGQTFASKNLATSYANIYYRTYVDLKANSTNVSLLWDRTAAGIALAHLYVDTTGKLGLRNDITGVAVASPVVVSRGTWHSLELHALVNGTSSTIEVWLDGVHVPALESTAANLGTALVGRVWLGENNVARTYDIAFDDVVIGGSYVGP